MALSLLLTDAGGMVGDVTIDHQDSDGFYLVGPSLGVRFYHRWLDRQSSGFDVRIVNVSDRVAAIGVAGPDSPDDAECASGRAFDDFPFMTSRQVNVGRTACRALRVSFSGELGWELHCPMSSQAALFDALMEGGKDHGLTLVGSRAMGMLRLEKGYRSWGAEITTEMTPHAAGLERFCSTSKDYIGRRAVDAERSSPPTSCLATLEIVPEAPPCWGTEPILKDGRLVGHVTSGGMGGWRCGRMLAVGRMDRELVHPGNALQVQILMESHGAVVVADPVYDPCNLRLKG